MSVTCYVRLLYNPSSYDEATQKTGYFNDNGIYQGGLPLWNWADDSFTCTAGSYHEEYCKVWNTER